MSKKTPYFSQVNMSKEGRPEHWWNRGLQLSEQKIREAMANTRSNKEAARWLGITDITYKKYAKAHIDEATGKSLFELHKNQAGKGMPKNWVGGQWKKNLDEMLVDSQPINSKRIMRLKDLLMKDGRLGYQCSTCQFSEKRLTDMKAPLLLNFVNGKKSDWRIENLRWLCYNCYFLYVEDPFSNKMIQRVESIPLDAPEIKEEAQTLFQLDEFYFNHLKNLGLDGQGDVRFKDIDTHTGTDELDDLVDYKK
jgi:hypothetical protein